MLHGLPKNGPALQSKVSHTEGGIGGGCQVSTYRLKMEALNKEMESAKP